jgi:uncharacterized Zn finger protein
MSVNFTARNARLYEATSSAKLRYQARKDAEAVRALREAATRGLKQPGAAVEASAPKLNPVRAASAVLCNTPLGSEWCNYLERYVDHNDRLWKGRAYIREGRVIDLKVAPGVIRGQVRGTKVHQVSALVAPLPKELWTSMLTESTASGESLVELLQGRVSWPVIKPLVLRKIGLFPKVDDLHFSCTCEDQLPVCKHVAAVLYGLGVRLDKVPHVLFKLRQVHMQELIRHAETFLPVAGEEPAMLTADSNSRRIDNSANIGELFGFDFA